uniref:Uncharacterized protein n=1 Tax=Megaselia scalaris TaxID=36166 RepID=T1GBB7_MEGSC
MKEKYSPRDEESPARTIDSHDSTIDSVETIVERQSQSQQPSTVDHSNAMKNSTNETNTTDNKNSLTNSQISMISGGHKDTSNKLSSISDTDAQSHIYSSPVYNAIKIDGNGDETSIDIEEQKPKLISHDEFQKQTNEEKAAKKQRIPPKLIPLKGVEKVKEAEIPQKPEAVAPSSSLGCLLIVREASTSSVGVGIWCGIVAAVTGALGVIDIKKVRTAFMALSLVCVATSVCGLAIAGFGLLKDVNESNEAKRIRLIHFLHMTRPSKPLCGNQKIILNTFFSKTCLWILEPSTLNHRLVLRQARCTDLLLPSCIVGLIKAEKTPVS